MKTQSYEDLFRENLDVVSVSGDELVCRCPFHGSDRTPSLWANVRKGLWTCYACNEGGSAKKLLRKLGKPVSSTRRAGDYVPGHVKLAEAVMEQINDLLAREEAKTCSCHEIYRALHRASKIHSNGVLTSTSGSDYSFLTPPPLDGKPSRAAEVTTGTAAGRCKRCNKPLIISEKTLRRFKGYSVSLEEYLTKRDINYHARARARDGSTCSSTRELFELGWDPISRAVVMPYRDEYGLLLGVVHRRLQGKPKYNYPRKFPRTETLFASWLVSSAPRRDLLPANWVVLCEGPFDVMKCWQAGVPAVGMWGSMLHDKQAQILSKLGVTGVCVFTDRDSAGRSAALSAARKLMRANFSVSVVKYPRSYPEMYSDPGSLPDALIRARVRRARRVMPWEI